MKISVSCDVWQMQLESVIVDGYLSFKIISGRMKTNIQSTVAFWPFEAEIHRWDDLISADHRSHHTSSHSPRLPPFLMTLKWLPSARFIFLPE
jgi:hypothetical protein